MKQRTKIVTWNVAWTSRRSKKAKVILERIFQYAPDIVCLTEAHTDFLPTDSGHVITSQADYGYQLKPKRRKVILWSKEPWTNVDEVGHMDMPSGRYVSAETTTPAGTIRVHGVCIPWFAAHVTTGRRDARLT